MRHKFSFPGISFLLDEIQMRSCFLIFFFASGDILKNKLTFGYNIARIRAISADSMEYDMSARTEGRRAGVPAGSTPADTQRHRPSRPDTDLQYYTSLY